MSETSFLQMFVMDINQSFFLYDVKFVVNPHFICFHQSINCAFVCIATKKTMLFA
jgi:hypothetical protein